MPKRATARAHTSPRQPGACSHRALVAPAAGVWRRQQLLAGWHARGFAAAAAKQRPAVLTHRPPAVFTQEQLEARAAKEGFTFAQLMSLGESINFDEKLCREHIDILITEAIRRRKDVEEKRENILIDALRARLRREYDTVYPLWTQSTGAYIGGDGSGKFAAARAQYVPPQRRRIKSAEVNSAAAE